MEKWILMTIKKSCNVYFYDMILKYQEKDNLIINELFNYSEKLGFNNKTGIEIFEQGRIPDSKWMNINEGKDTKAGSMQIWLLVKVQMQLRLKLSML